MSYVLSYGQLQESWIISGLQWWNVNEYRLPSKNAHSPNYCSWLAVCVNYSANFYCKIALINRFKLYLIKTYSKTPKKQNKQNKRKQKQRRIYLMFTFSERHVTVCHYNDTRSRECLSLWHTVDRDASIIDNDIRQVTAFRPINEEDVGHTTTSAACYGLCGSASHVSVEMDLSVGNSKFRPSQNGPHQPITK